MPDVESVAAARKKIAAVYKDWLKESYDTQLSEMGSKKTRDQLPPIDPATGAWADVGIQSKPLAWIVEFRRGTDGWTAILPASNYPSRLGGSFNSKSPLQGVLSRILPVVRISDDPPVAEPHLYWEWAMALVFPGRPVFQTRGSSGGVIEFNPSSGRLWSPVDEDEIDQPYVDSALFKLLADDERWSDAVNLTYGEATSALARLIHVANAEPSEPFSDGGGENDDDDVTPINQGDERRQTIDYRLARADEDLRALFHRADEFLQQLGRDIRITRNQQYYAYSRETMGRRSFASLEIYPTTGVKLYLIVDPATVEIEPGYTRKMSGLHHFGDIGDLEVIIRTPADFEKSETLMRRAYEAARI
jgi:predicted transport protein